MMNAAQFIILLGSSSNAPLLQMEALWDTYEAYVEADSGTAEAKSCTVNELLSTFEYSKGALILSDYILYVEADSGTFEAQTCTRNALSELL